MATGAGGSQGSVRHSVAVTAPTVPDARPRERSEREVIAYLAFMGILMAFGVDAALPAFDDLRTAFDLAADSNRISLTVTLYLIGLAIGQLAVGPIADRYGRVLTLRLGICLYSLGALGSIVSPDLTWLLISRAIWGVGAAAPGALRTTVARDLYSGAQMARVVSIASGFFMMGPVIAPIVGQGILAISSWQWVFGASLILAAVLGVWTIRFGETLEPANRRAIDPAGIVAGFRAVLANRQTLGYTLALTFGFGAFFVFLGSSHPIIDDIYGRGDQFALWFGLASVAMAVSFFSVNRFIVRRGAHRTAVVTASAAVALSLVLTALSIAGDGVPSFAVWLGFIAVINALTTLLTPTCYSLGLEPMGSLAGTASGVMGFVSTAGGSLLAAAIDASIDGSVTPMAVAYAGYVSLALVSMRWARA